RRRRARGRAAVRLRARPRPGRRAAGHRRGATGLARGVGRGKVILLGEHAVVYGHAALAAALSLDVAIDPTPAGKDSVPIAGWGMRAGLHPAVAGVKAAAGVTAPVAIVGTATLPARAGLGSSAAMAVAVARALGAADVEDAAMAGERVFHRNPSGID